MARSHRDLLKNTGTLDGKMILWSNFVRQSFGHMTPNWLDTGPQSLRALRVLRALRALRAFRSLRAPFGVLAKLLVVRSTLPRIFLSLRFDFKVTNDISTTFWAVTWQIFHI